MLSPPPEHVLSVSTTLLIGVISGGAIIIAVLASVVTWIIRNRNNVQSESGTYGEEDLMEFEMDFDNHDIIVDWGNNVDAENDNNDACR